MPETPYVLAFSCPNRAGIVAAVAGKIFALGGQITDSQQYDDQSTGQFFSRTKFTLPDPALPPGPLRAEFDPVLAPLDARWILRPHGQRKRALIMVSQHDHCLTDLLHRQQSGDLRIDIAGIVSNHPAVTHQGIGWGGIPYFHLPITPGNKQQQEEKLLGLVGELGVDFVVLARYMQILSNDLSAEFSGRCINIHHSFLPGFKGAKPYHQAYQRGVKLVGATAHYVTGDLDEGPIIVQAVEPISHRDTPGSLVRKGRDIERRVLAAAVHHHADDRVFLNGRTTVVFPE